jgi:hypothetical protein
VLTTDDVTGLSIVTSRPAKLAGQIVFESGLPPPFKPAEVGMWATSVEQRSSMFGGPIKTRDDWTFEGTAQDSPALLRGRIAQSDWRIRTVLQRGVDVTDTGNVFRPGEVVDDLQVILTNRVSRITGTVTTDRGGTAKEYAVVVYADDPDRWGPMTRYIESARPDQQGQFEIKGLPPGNYLARGRVPRGGARPRPGVPAPAAAVCDERAARRRRAEDAAAARSRAAVSKGTGEIRRTVTDRPAPAPCLPIPGRPRRGSPAP